MVSLNFSNYNLFWTSKSVSKQRRKTFDNGSTAPPPAQNPRRLKTNCTDILLPQTRIHTKEAPPSRIPFNVLVAYDDTDCTLSIVRWKSIAEVTRPKSVHVMPTVLQTQVMTPTCVSVWYCKCHFKTPTTPPACFPEWCQGRHTQRPWCRRHTSQCNARDAAFDAHDTTEMRSCVMPEAPQASYTPHPPSIVRYAHIHHRHQLRATGTSR